MLFLNTIRFIFTDLLLSVLYFPIWWYTTGVKKVVELIVHHSRALAHSLRIGVLLRFLFQPMFGMTDIWSRMISFGVRVIHFLILSLATFLYTLLLFVGLIVWLLLPPFILYSISFHLSLVNIADYV